MKELFYNVEILCRYSRKKKDIEYKTPPTVKEIDASAFYYCKLKKITISEGCEKIGRYAFGKTEITEFIIPDSVTEIGDYAINCDYYIVHHTITREHDRYVFITVYKRVIFTLPLNFRVTGVTIRRKDIYKHFSKAEKQIILTY